MRFLIDNGLSPKVAIELCRVGHDAVHVRELAMQTASDEEIFDRAHAEGRVVVSQHRPCVNCCDLTSKNSSHFSSADSCRRRRRIPSCIVQPSWDWARQPPRIRLKHRATSITRSDANHKRQLDRELLRRLGEPITTSQTDERIKAARCGADAIMWFG